MTPAVTPAIITVSNLEIVPHSIQTPWVDTVFHPPDATYLRLWKELSGLAVLHLWIVSRVGTLIRIIGRPKTFH